MNPTCMQYFVNNNIDVSLNTLGRTPALVQAYVTDTQDVVSADIRKMSENVKHACYSRFYTMASRTKLTGFEAFRSQDVQFRIAQSSIITSAQITPALVLDTQPTAVGYKDALKSSFADFTKPIFMYLSGGLDSELVAISLLDAGKTFTPVIFQWTNNLGVIQNATDTAFAFSFCTAHALTPIVETVNLEMLWVSPEFAALALAIQIVSPQLVTHAYMVNLMATQYPGKQHILGGEVRYRPTYLKDDGSLANIVLLTKVTPGYNGVGYTHWNSVGIDTMGLILNADGSWQVFNALTGSPTTGVWANAPLSVYGYEYRVTAIYVAGGVGTTYPTGPTGWASISGAQCSITWGDGTSDDVSADFYLEIRGIHDHVVNPSVISFWGHI